MYYVNKIDNHIGRLGFIDDLELIPVGCVECTESEYLVYKEQIKIQKYGTVEQIGLNECLREVRNKRVKHFEAFDIYKANLSYGIITETTIEKEEILLWYNEWKALPESITVSNYTNVTYPVTPTKIAEYLIV